MQQMQIFYLFPHYWSPSLGKQHCLDSSGTLEVEVGKAGSPRLACSLATAWNSLLCAVLSNVEILSHEVLLPGNFRLLLRNLSLNNFLICYL